MTRVERCLTLQSSPSEIFAEMVDIEAIPNWIPNIKKASVTSPTPMEVGATFVQHILLVGQSFEITAKVAAYDPPAEFGYIYAEGLFASVWNYQVTTAGNSSRLLITVEFTETSGLTGLFKRLLRPLFPLIINRNIYNFCAWVEHKQASTL